jgi:hypothetical protein
VVFFATLRFIRIATRLCVYFGEKISPDKIRAGETDPNILAAFALTHRSPRDSERQQDDPDEASRARSSREKALQSLLLAETRFLYLLSKCYIDLESTKRAVWLTFLLTLMMGAFGAMPIYSANCNNNRFQGLPCLLDSASQLFNTLGLGLLFCVALHLKAGFFERALSIRKAEWRHFFATLKNELSRRP